MNMKSVLIVNESKIYRRAIAQVFEKLCCIVHEADSGSQGRQILSKHSIDLALIDENSVTIDGLALKKWIHTLNQERDIPIIISSSNQTNNSLFQF